MPIGNIPTSYHVIFGEAVLSHVASTYDVEDVFTKGELGQWAKDNGYIDPDDSSKRYAPDDVFTYDELAKWATSQGFALDCESR